MPGAPLPGPTTERPATERVTDFLEIYGLYDEVVAQTGSRYVQCPEPLCVAGCPLSAHIPTGWR